MKINQHFKMKKKNSIAVILTLALTLPVTIMIVIMFAGTGCNVSQTRPEGPCDIYTAADNPCMAAHSSTRALYKSYNGPLYQIMRQSDGKTLDIGVVRPGKGDPGGYADAAAHDAFCANTLCWITTLYDQSGNCNHLVQAPPGTFSGPAKGGFNTLPIADMAPITIMGHKAYGVYIIPGMGLRSNDATGLAINDEPQGIYMVCDGKHFDSGCCFNYGNTSTNSRAVGRGTMETVYFGTSTAWGSGNGPGPWIMSDMEAGLFSGYDAKQNPENPTIDSWRFVTGIVNGGGGNRWEIWGADAQEGELETFYKGIRPHSPDNDWYNPMHRKGAVQMGNGGDNGNGSAGTFYEGVMVTGYPDETTLNAVQANIVAARYDVQRVSLSRVMTFTPGSSQEVEATFTNTTGAPVSGLTLSISLPEGWTALESGSGNASVTFRNRIAPGAGMSATFTVTSGPTTGAGFMTCRAEWKDQVATNSQRVRNAFPVKINEIRLSTGISQTDQFIELFNAGDSDVDISRWTLINTRSGWAPVRLATVPGGTRLTAHGFYLLKLSASGLVAPASSGDKIINVTSTTGFKAGQQIDIDGELRRIAIVGTAAAPMTTVFVPVSTGPWLTIPAGSVNLPVTNATGFEAGRKIGIDIGGNYEVATVTAVGKAATQTNLAEAANAGDTIIKVAANGNMTIGDTITINTGVRKELVVVKRLINVVSAPIRGGFDPGGPGGNGTGEVELTAPLRFGHLSGVDVSGRGTGISFSPATRFAHKSGDAVQALGDGITLVSALDKNHDIATAVINPLTLSADYQVSAKPNQWYGVALSTAAGSIALMDASGMVVVDAIVYGSRQSNSSANGTITSPELATLEGDQSQGGCIVVAPGSGTVSRMFPPVPPKTDRSIGRFPDGADTDSNCSDFRLQNTITLVRPATAGSDNIKTGNMADFVNGQKIIIGTGTNSETAFIKIIGTAGGTTVGTTIKAGSTVIPVRGVEGFNSGQTITIDGGTKLETAVVSSVSTGRRFFGGPGAIIPMDSIKLSMPLKYGHAAGAQVSGSGITLASPLTRDHDISTQVASDIPTPGKPNLYTSTPL